MVKFEGATLRVAGVAGGGTGFTVTVVDPDLELSWVEIALSVTVPVALFAPSRSSRAVASVDRRLCPHLMNQIALFLARFRKMTKAATRSRAFAFAAA
jgi:hypothetical protein